MKTSESIDNHSKSLYFKFQADISKNAPVGIFLNLPEKKFARVKKLANFLENTKLASKNSKFFVNIPQDMQFP